jgi:hypothetical protein
MFSTDVVDILGDPVINWQTFSVMFGAEPKTLTLEFAEAYSLEHLSKKMRRKNWSRLGVARLHLCSA